MSDAAIEAVLRRDRVIVAAAVVVLTVLAWAYVWWLAADMDMGGMDMSDFRMIPAGMGLMMPATAPWTTTEFAFVFVMWAVMMIGMMTPTRGNDAVESCDLLADGIGIPFRLLLQAPYRQRAALTDTGSGNDPSPAADEIA